MRVDGGPVELLLSSDILRSVSLPTNGNFGLVPDFRRALHERLLLDKNLWSKRVGQIRSFLTALPYPTAFQWLDRDKNP